MMLVDIGWKKEKKSEFFLVLSFSSPTLSLDPPPPGKKVKKQQEKPLTLHPAGSAALCAASHVFDMMSRGSE
jgi:hypothetical protein